jgi:sensor histidine kinase YesM
MCWALFFSFPYLLQPLRENNFRRPGNFNSSEFIYVQFLNNTLRVLLFYANAFVFVPRLIYKKKYFQYLLTLLVCAVALSAFDRLFAYIIMGGLKFRGWMFVKFQVPLFIFVIIASTSFRMIRDRIKQDKRINDRETENLKTELSFLRSQVSPHFMFNVLNNMVALARKKSDLLEPSLIKLSQLLRYMLYETNEDKVMVEKEVEYLQSYIDLQKQRFGKNVDIITSFEGIEREQTIAPMLLIPFVENAFKHGTGLMETAKINIRLKVQEGQLHFLVRNRFNEAIARPKDETSGIGLTNVKRRLNLLYNQQYSLQIDKNDNWFTVALHLNLL